MARQKDQVMRFSDVDIATMRSLFNGNDDLLFTLRKFFLQGKLTPTENELVKKLVSPVVSLIRKILLPELDYDAPFGQLIDLINTLNGDIKEGKSAEEMYIRIAAKQVVIDYLDQQLILLEGKTSVSNIKLSDLSKIKGVDEKQSYINIIARNYLIAHIDSQFQQTKVLADRKEETLADTKERLKKNSNK